MFNIEEVCKKCSKLISKELNLEQDKEAIVNYGIFSIIQMGISITLVGIFGAIFGVFLEALIVSFTGSILRKSSGGAHADSPGKCTIIGIIISVGLALICKKNILSTRAVIIIGVFVFLWAYYLIWRLAPVDSPAKPITNEKKRERLKKSSIVILSIYLVIVTLNIVFFYLKGNANLLIYSLCMYFSIVWQVFSLTKSGHYFLGKIGTFYY